MPEPIATWNPARGAWEKAETTVLCGHRVLFSGTWPASGMTRGGSLYPLPTSEPPTGARGSSSPPSLLPTPTAHDDGKSPEAHLAMKARLPGGPRSSITSLSVLARNAMRPVLLKTPTAQLAVNGGSQHPDKRRAGGHGPTLADQVEHLLPTPAARDWKSGQSNIMDRNARPLNEVVEMLLPTPRATDGTKGGPNQRGSSGDLMLPSAVMQLLPTPTAADSRNSRNATAGRSPESSGHPRKTLCDVFWTGESTNSPSAAGNASSAGRPPVQLSLDELESG